MAMSFPMFPDLTQADFSAQNMPAPAAAAAPDIFGHLPKDNDIFGHLPKDGQTGSEAVNVSNVPYTGQDLGGIWDMARSLGTGIRSGLEAIPALPGDVGHGMRWLSNKAATALGFEDNPDYVAGKPVGDDVFGKINRALTPESPHINAVTSSVIGDSYDPQTTGGKYARSVGTMLPGALSGGGGVLRNLLRFGVAPGLASEALGQAYEGTSAEPWARVAGGLLGGLAGGALGAEAIPQTAAQAERARLAAIAAREGIHLPEAAMQDNPIQRYAAGKTGQIPVIGAPLKQSALDTAETMSDALNNVADTMGTGRASYANAQRATNFGLTDWMENASRADVARAYDAVDQLITPQGARVLTPLANTQHAYDDIVAEMHASTATAALPILNRVEEALSRPQGLTYQGMKQLRTELGGLDDANVMPDPGARSAVRRLYGAMSDDLEASIRRAGGHPAYLAWQNANTLKRNTVAQQERLLPLIGKQAQLSAEASLNRMLNMAGDTSKASANIRALQDARSSVINAARERLGLNDPAQLANMTAQQRQQLGTQAVQTWHDIGAGVLTRMGRDPTQPATYFSPERFLTAWGKLSPQGRSLMFGPATAQRIEEIADLARQHRELMRAGNPSGTGGVVTGAALATGLFTHPMATLGTLGSGYTMARIMARPIRAEKMINWMRARNGMLQSGTPTAINSLLNTSRNLASDIHDNEGGDVTETFNKLAGVHDGE